MFETSIDAFGNKLVEPIVAASAMLPAIQVRKKKKPKKFSAPRRTVSKKSMFKFFW